MAIQFYAGSGSPYVWRVWLALEHKALPYELRMLSFTGGDLAKPEYAALNPRRKVPTIVDNGYALYESAAIVEYLEDAYRSSGGALFPADVKARAIARRHIREIDEYVAQRMEVLVTEVLFKPQAEWNQDVIAKGRDKLVSELGRWDQALTGDYFTGGVGAVDFALYPLVALTLRMEDKKKPDLGIRAALGSKLKAWMKRIEALPFFDKTYPPHWKAG